MRAPPPWSPRCATTRVSSRVRGDSVDVLDRGYRHARRQLVRRRRRGRRRVTGCGRDGVRVQHRRDKEGEQPRVKTEGMRGSAKANGSVLGSVHYDALASHGMSRGVVTAPGGTTSGTPATTSDTQTASSSSTATTSKETTLTVVLTDEAEEKEVRGDISPARVYISPGEKRRSKKSRRFQEERKLRRLREEPPDDLTMGRFFFLNYIM
ncbi:uncharacterized protein LOC123407048 [Hordeum vulgare subsp. vulgare]|uniref:uncharacterized protein LOC123407048 n=1 Tax=Hordeum vulgare subsp. vulgare TaxID=112509 RepID=UPI001D1A384A|nr:uncharacterized protein LOC123407048 [Hordeum vulgare subsp. vulgare]